MNPVCYNTDLLDNSGMTVYGVTNYLLIGLKACFTGRNTHLVLYVKSKSMTWEFIGYGGNYCYCLAKYVHVTLPSECLCLCSQISAALDLRHTDWLLVFVFPLGVTSSSGRPVHLRFLLLSGIVKEFRDTKKMHTAKGLTSASPRCW